MENRMDSIKTPVISSSVDKLIDIKYKRRSSRLQNLQIIESDSKDSSLKSSISALENNRTSEQGTSTSGLCVTPHQPSTNFDCEISNELNIVEQHSKEKYLKKYTNSKYYTDNNYEDTEDVSKVFKLISKSNFNSNVKSSQRSTLKTYTNPRKSLGKNEVVESFGLPDTPIIPEKPLVNSNLDAEVLDAKEITIQELQFVDEPWCIIEFEENFTNPHEIRIKPDPQTDIKSCYSNASTINENVINPGFQSSHTLLNIVQKPSSIVDMLDGHTKRSKNDSKKILKSPSKSEIIIENNSLAPEGHEVEICKVNSFHNTSTVDTNKLPQAKTKKVKDINYNERRTIRSNINKYSIKEIQLDGNIHYKKSLRGGVEDNSAIESRKLRSSNITEDASTLETEMQRKADRAEVKNNYEVIYNELGNSSGIRNLRSSGIHHTKVFNIEMPKIKITTKCDSTSNEGNASFNDNEEESQETKKIIAADSKEIHDNTLLKSIEIGKLLSPNMSSDLEATSETKYNIPESNANKIYNQFKDSIHSTPEHSIIITDSISPNLRTSRRRDKFNIANETVLKSFVSKECISDSHTPSKKYNLRSNEQFNTPSNEKGKHKFASPKKVPSILDTSTKNIEIHTTLKNQIKSTLKKTFRYTNTTVDFHEAEIQSDISEMESTTSTRILRSNSCPEIVLHPKSLENSKSTKVSKLQNHEVMTSKGIEHKGLDDYYCLRKPKNDPILPTKEKQLKVILHPLKKYFNAYTNRRKDHVNNKTRNRRFSTIHTPKHVTNIEKSSRSCEMLLEIVDIIPVSDKPKRSSKLLQSKPFLNLFKNTELPLPETLLVEGEIKKTSNSRKPEPKNPVKNSELLSSTSNENNKNDRSKSTIKDTNLICQLSKWNFKLMQNNKNKDSMISSQEVANIDSYIEVSHSCKSDTPPEKTNIIEQMQTSPIKSEVKTTNKLKKSPESKAEFTELKNLIKKISEVEGRKCKMLTNEKLSECLKSRSYHKKSCNDDMSSVNTEPSNDFLQQTVENKSDGPHNTSKEKSLITERKQPLNNMSPTDQLRNRTRKIIEMLSEDITNPLIQESRSATFKKTFSSVQLENTPLKNDKDLIVNYSNSQSSSCEIIVEDEMNKTPIENNEKELLENVETACPKFQNILMNNESVKLLDKKVCRVALDFKPSKPEVNADTTKLAKFLNKDKNTMITKKNKSDIAEELETHETSLTENVKHQVNSSEQSKNVSEDTLYCDSTNTSKYRELRKIEDKCIDKLKTPRKFSQKGSLVLETKSPSENITNLLETPTDGSYHNEAIKKGRGRPRKSPLVKLDNKLDGNNSKLNKEITNFNAHLNICNENIFNGRSESNSEKNVTNILATNNTDISIVENTYDHTKNILKSEETTVIKYLPSDTILEDEMNKTPIENNEKELLENAEMSCPKFQNILMNIESVKLLNEKVCRVALDFKSCKPDSKKLATSLNNDKNTMIIEKNNDAEENKETILETHETSLMENVKSQVNSGEQSKNVAADTLYSNSTNSAKHRELRKREEKCLDKPKTPRKFSQKGNLVLEAMSPSKNITNMLETPTDTIKRGRGRPRKSLLVELDNKLDENNSKLNEEINFNAHINIFNGSSESNSEKNVTNILSTNSTDISRVENNYDRTKNILKSEETAVIKYLRSDIILEDEMNKTPIKNNEKKLLENVEMACPKFENILMNNESVKLLDEKVCRVALDFKPSKPEVNAETTKLSTFLSNDKNTMITEKNKSDVAEENKETILETRKTSLMKNVKSQVNSSEHSKNISADTSYSNSTNSSNRRELRKREEKCVDKPKTPRRLSKKGNLVIETISPNENITNMLETPTDGSTHNEASKRGSRSRPRKLPLVKLDNKLHVNDSKLNEEINFNAHLNISNEIVFNESSEICTSNSEENITLSTNNRNISNVGNSYDHSEETTAIKYLPSAKVNTNQIEDITAPKIDINKNKYLGANIAACEKMNIVTETSAIISNSDIITELESSDILVVTNMPPKIELTQKENNTSAVITGSNERHEDDKTESTEINKDDETKNTGLNKVDKTESKNSTIDHTEINITGNTNVNKYCITKNTLVIKNNIKRNYVDKSGITDTFSKGDTKESIWLNKKYTTESTKAHNTGLKKRHATVKTASGKGKLAASSVVDKIDIIESSETKDDNVDNDCTVQTDSVKNINTSTDYNTHILNEENTLKNNACVVNNETDSTKAAEKTVKPVIDNLQLNKECTSKENDDSFLEITNAETYIQKDLVSSPSILNTEKYEYIDNNLKQYFLDEENNQQNLLDREVSTSNENLDGKIIKNLNQEEVKSPVRLRSKTSLGQRSRASIDTSKKSRHPEEFSHKTPNKQRYGENDEQHKCKRASPRIRNNSTKVSKSLIDGEIGIIRGLRERSTDLEVVQYQIDSGEHSGMKNISTRTRSKTSLGERIDGNLDEDFIPQNMTRSKSSLGVRINDNEYGSFSHNITQSTLATTAAGISANIQCLEILDMIEKGERISRSKSIVATAEYLDGTTCVETDSSEILLRKSLVPVDRKVVKRSKSIGDVQDTHKLRNITKFRPKIGDIVWAQIGKYPFWPSLVSKDPVTCSFKNNMKNRCMYHVKFFGDMGRRAWISGKKLMEYKSRDDLKMCYNNLKNYKSGAELQAYIIRTYVVDRWTRAVDEVEFVKSQNFTFKQIISYMETMPEKEESNQEPEENKQSTLKKERKRRQSLSLDDLTDLNNLEIKKMKLEGEELVSTSKEKSRQKRSSKGAETADNCINFSSPELKCEDSSISKIDEKTEDFIVIKDEQSDMEYKINLNTFKNFGSYTLEEQRSLFKRNNLFKGIPKEKVCQYCFDFGELLKCKGGCNGIYHPYCATRVLEQKHPKTKKARRSLKIEHTEKVESIKIEKIEPPSSPGNQLEVDNNHVQIVTIPSNVYNTPPRKTFPPDFENMTLGERIDFKMKEIMKKFESTTYAEVLNESPSEEKSTTNKSLVCGSFSAKCQDLFSAGVQRSPQQNIELDKELDSMLKPIDHVTADSVPLVGHNDSISNIKKYSGENIVKSETDSLIKHVTADSEYSSDVAIKNNASKKEIKNQSKQRNSLVKHITADSPLSRQSSTDNKDFPNEPVKTKTFNGHRKSKNVTTESDNVDSESLRSSSSGQSKQSDVSENSDTYRNINPKNFKCGFCANDVDPYCFICNETMSKKGSHIRQKCSLYQCARFYHPECLKLWPQTQWSVIQTTKNRYSQEEVDSFVCPQHVCHTCASDDPRAALSRCSWDKIVKCLCCPASYHSTNLCVPAGTEIITSTQIICPRHRNKYTKPYTINTTWCLLCNEGGKLICCETCPTSVHTECMTVNLTDDDKFICEDCESGRLPLYDEVVWVKLGYFKWWPALIIFPNEVPQNVFNAKHSLGEFVVKFFGTYNYYWMNRGRAFLFQEGDNADTGPSTKKKVEAAFQTAVEEAVIAHKMKKQFKLTQSAESVNSMKPPPYIKIKVSKPVGNVRFMDLDLSNTTACDCNPSQPNPCGPDSNCLNRLLLTECNPEVCPAGKLCNNQSFEKREYPLLVPYKTETRGWGLKTLEPVKKGQFVIEYVGELIDDEEYQRRILKMHAQKEENYYFLTIHKDRMIDAGPKGNMARFMNHCCQPNCETQKWTVNGDTRVGLFATTDIPAHTELTFNYNLECTGTEKKVCQCGAPNCSGFIGVKVKNESTENKKPKKERKKKEPEKPLDLPPCFICQKKGNVSLCNNKICNKAYHLRCLKLEVSEGKKFICPWHYCNICSKRTIRCCVKCLNSFCPSHSEGNVRYDNLLGFVCSTHDPKNAKAQTSNVTVKRKRNHQTTDDAVVTSTTDDNDDEDDDVSLLQRMRQSKKNGNNGTLGEDNGDLDVSGQEAKKAVSKSQNETVSSAIESDFGNELKQKRKKKTKRRLLDKRLKFKNERIRPAITANSVNGSNVSDATR